jgi:hypothetical protein
MVEQVSENVEKKGTGGGSQEHNVIVSNEDMQSHQTQVAAGEISNSAAQELAKSPLEIGSAGISASEMQENLNHLEKKIVMPRDQTDLPGGGGKYLGGVENEALVLDNGAIVQTNRNGDVEVSGTKPATDVTKDGVRTLTYKDGSQVVIGEDGIQRVTTVQEHQKFGPDGIKTYYSETNIGFHEGPDGIKRPHEMRKFGFDVKPTNPWKEGFGGSGGGSGSFEPNVIPNQQGNGRNGRLQQQLDGRNN